MFERFRKPRTSESKSGRSVTNLGSLVSLIESKDLELFVRGYFNVEGGQACVSSGKNNHCECSLGLLGPVVETCGDCGADRFDYVSLPSGMGDGIYVVAEIRASPDSKPLGALVTFESQYTLANAVREQVAQEKVPDYPIELISELPVTDIFKVAQIRSAPKIFLSDASGFGGTNAGVSVELGDKELDVLALTFPIAPGLESWATVYADLTGIPLGEPEKAEIRALSEYSGRDVNNPDDAGLPNLFFVGALILSEELKSALQLSVSEKVLDWDDIELRQGVSIVTSHMSPMGTSVMLENYLLAREWDRVAGDTISDQQALEHLFECWSWLFQAALNGERDALAIVRANTYKPSRDEILSMLSSRGSSPTSQQIDNLFDEPGLPKKTNGLLKKSAKYCSNCGEQTDNGLNKFCPGCGVPFGNI